MIILCTVGLNYSINEPNNAQEGKIFVDLHKLSAISYSNMSILSLSSNGGRRWSSQDFGLQVNRLALYFSSLLSRDPNNFVAYGSNVLCTALVMASLNHSVIALQTVSSQDYKMALRELKLKPELWKSLIREIGGGSVDVLNLDKYASYTRYHSILMKAPLIFINFADVSFMEALMISKFIGVILLAHDRDRIVSVSDLNLFICKYKIADDRLEVFEAGIFGTKQILIFDIGKRFDQHFQLEANNWMSALSLSEVACRESSKIKAGMLLSPVILSKVPLSIPLESASMIEKCIFPSHDLLSSDMARFYLSFGKLLSHSDYNYVVYGEDISEISIILSTSGHSVIAMELVNLKINENLIYPKTINCIETSGGGRIVKRPVQSILSPSDEKILLQTLLVVTKNVYPTIIEKLLNVSYKGFLVIDTFEPQVPSIKTYELFNMLCKYGVYDYRKNPAIDFYDFSSPGGKPFGLLLDFTRQLTIQKNELLKSRIAPMTISDDKCVLNRLKLKEITDRMRSTSI